MYVERKTTLLEAGTCSTLLSWENWVSFEANSPATWVSQGGVRLSLNQSFLFSSVDKKPWSLKRKLSVWEREGSTSFFPLEIDLILNLIVPTNSVIRGAVRLCWFHTGPFRCTEVTRASLKRKPSGLEGRGSSPLLPCDQWVMFWKEYFLQHRWFKVERGSGYSKNLYSAQLKKHVYVLKEKHQS